MISASHAKKLSEDNFSKILEDVDLQISTAAGKGEFSIVLEHSPECAERIKVALDEAGFSCVNSIQGRQLLVSWK